MESLVFDYFHNTPGGDEKKSGLMVEAAGHFRLVTHAIRERVRPDYLLLFCVGGTGYYGIANMLHTIGPGDLFLAPPGIPHSYGCDPRTGWDIWYVHFRGTVADNLLQLTGLGGKNLVVHVGVASLETEFAAVSQLLKEKPLHFGLDASCAVFRLLVALKKTLDEQALRHRGLVHAMEIAPSDVDEMARAANMSKYHFIRSFREATGATPWRHVINRRMMEAKELLSGHDLTIKQIAFRLGFSDPNYFSRAFRKETGMSPKQFRRAQMP